MALTKAERFKRVEDKRKKDNIRRVHGIWAHDEDREAIRVFARNLLEKRKASDRV